MDERSHALVVVVISGQCVKPEMVYPGVERLFLGEITDVELDLLSFCGCLDAEVEPLEMPLRVGVHTHEEVVLILADLHRAVQVTAFESRLKAQRKGM